MYDVPNVLNQSYDDPRLLLSEPFRAVHFVFGLFHPAIPPLPGRAVLGALEALGFGDEAARGILLRLRRRGFLESTRTGRSAAYALSPRSMALVDEISRRAALPPPAWSGAFITLVVRVPAADRAFREQLRRHAFYAGLGSPIPGLLLATDPGAIVALEPLLARAPRDASIARGTLALPVEDARTLARDAWNLEPLAARLRSETARMDAAATEAAARPVRGADALGFLWQSIGPFFELLSERRSLPEELLPDDWPLARANETFGRLAMVAAGPAHDYVAALAGGR